MLKPKQCKHCGKLFRPVQNSREFCSKKCFYDSIAIKPRKCQYCSASFFRKGNRDYRFCSPACRNKARSLSIIPCPICGTGFKPQRINGVGNLPKRYCSQKCARYAMRGKPSPKRTDIKIINAVKALYPRAGAQYLAKQFNKSIKAIQMIAKKIGVRLDPDVYREHVHESARSYMKTSKNPGYVSGITCKEWGNNWLEQRNRARKRDLYTCQYCGKPGRSVHHIKPRREFIGHMKDSNTLSNLITLCARDHRLIEMGKLPCPHPI